jgi:hypothetical protein
MTQSGKYYISLRRARNARTQTHQQLNYMPNYLMESGDMDREQIDVCLAEDVRAKLIHTVTQDACQPLYEVHWMPTWQLEPTISGCETGYGNET